MIRFWGLIAFLLFSAASELRAHSTTIITEGSFVQDRNWRQVELNVKLSKQVPYRIYLLDAPKRLIVEFGSIGFQNLDLKNFVMSKSTSSVTTRVRDDGWFILSLELLEPLGLKSAEMKRDKITGEANLSIWLEPVTEKEFVYLVKSDQFVEDLKLSKETKIEKKAYQDGRVRIVLDPGHGGNDPGAMAGEYKESELMLKFALELKEVLMRIDTFDVFLTRHDDRFLSLNERIMIAKKREADLFISLHADAVTEGIARGTTVYTLSQEASDNFSKTLALEHDRSSLLKGTDLTGTDYEIANIIINLAATETMSRSEALAKVTIEELLLEIGSINSKPFRQGDFSVLKSPDIPSILIEVGFMSTKSDLDKLKSPIWRKKFIDGLRRAIQRWISEDKVDAIRRRQ